MSDTGEALAFRTSLGASTATEIRLLGHDLADDLNAARRPLFLLALLLLVVGLVSALVSRRGIAQRLQEYR